ncbi:MAG: Hpt domain-containing protein, partial [Candidatus Eremiobacteraeota bacterium]|nr:Hpt domain-containing protein [Candidatus Eremiobacteraeota bacterium]
DMLLELFDHDRDSVVTVLDLAVVTIGADVLRIERAFADLNFGEAAEAAHSMKDAAASIGASRLTQLASSVVSAARAEPKGVAPESYAELRDAVQALRADVKQFAAGGEVRQMGSTMRKDAIVQ